MEDFYRGRSFKVRVGEKISEQNPVLAGLPQGSLLGPILYNICVSDVPAPPERGLLMTYADDVLLAFYGSMASTISRHVNAYLEKLHRYFTHWKHALNVGKYVAVVFGGWPPNLKDFVPEMKLGCELIRVSFCRNIDYNLEKAKGIYFGYHWLLRTRGGLPRKMRLLIYKQVFRSVITYTLPVWP